VPGSNLTGDQNFVIILVLYQELRVSCTVGARISKRPRYGQVRHRVSSGVVVQVWRPRNQPSCPLPAPRPANLHFRVRAVQAILTPGLKTNESMLQPYMNFVQHGLKVMTGCFTSFSTKSWRSLHWRFSADGLWWTRLQTWSLDMTSSSKTACW
jgi:hypothetical protein